MSSIPAAVGSNDPLFTERFRAMSSRDARFDGQFITGVHSTGIYCRPSCPAMTPKPGNVTFYRTAAAAHEAGLRACKRCLPDAVPGSPEWNIGDGVASRAMRLIADGTVERDGVTGLAESLGYTTRHLGRVLQRELGAGPLALARAHRAQTARTLLVETDLPIADVAFAAGFASIRQFNETVRAVYELTPSELRSRGRHNRGRGRTTEAAAAPIAEGAGTTITLRLPARAPFDAAGLLNYFALHAVTGMEATDGTTFRRRMRLPHGVAEVALDFDLGTDAPPVVTCTATLTELADLGTLVARVRRLLDLDADSAAIDEVLGRDEVLAPLVRAVPGIRLPGSLDSEETLFRTMIGQQVSIAAARTVSGRIAGALSATPGLFPTAVEIAERGHEVLRGPSTRVAAIIGAARAIAGGELQLDLGTPVEEFRAALERLPGIGPWTSGYLAMRVLGSPDILLTTDLVMLANASKLGLPASARGLAKHGERFAPWRSYAGMHLWRAAGPLAAP